ncbi:MAG: hypothetical protein ACYSWU_23005 [Planctomycetota bacterium]
MGATTLVAALVIIPGPLLAKETEETLKQRPNVILCMTDDQDWRDARYNGHLFSRTPPDQCPSPQFTQRLGPGGRGGGGGGGGIRGLGAGGPG